MIDFNGIDMSKLDLSSLRPPQPYIPTPQTHINEKDTVQYKIKEQTEQLSKNQQEQIEILKEQLKKSEKQIELLEKNNQENGHQIRLLNEQVEQLQQNYNKIDALYKTKTKELKEAETNEKRNRRISYVSIIISIISLGVVILSWLFPRG